MAIFYDTNILIAIARDSSKIEKIRNRVNKTKEVEYISVVSIAEIESLAYRNRWGESKKNRLRSLLNDLNVVDINDNGIIEKYVEIDAYSQGKHIHLKLPLSSRNMGKHDIWIASTACYLKMKLISTDKDFDHLQQIFIDLERFLPSNLIE